MSDEPTLAAKPAQLHKTEKSSVFVQLSAELRIQQGTAERLLVNSENGLAYKVAQVIRVLRRGDFHKHLAVFWAPIIAAYEDRPAPRTLKQLRHKAESADLSEDLHESLVQESESPGNLRMWARELRTEAGLGLELADAADARAKELEDKSAGGTGA